MSSAARPSVAIVPTGVANLASVMVGLRRAGAEPWLERDADAVAAADFAVLPGVGAFGAGMAELSAAGLGDALLERVRAGRPLLAVCLGMHLLCAASEESPGVAGLGVVRQTVEHFPQGVRAPQFGWNRIQTDDGCRLLQGGYAYFANSYRIATPPAGWSVARAEHGGSFVAAMERERVLACQFHPELSSEFGIELLRRWLEDEPC